VPHWFCQSTLSGQGGSSLHHTASPITLHRLTPGAQKRWLVDYITCILPARKGSVEKFGDSVNGGRTSLGEGRNYILPQTSWRGRMEMEKRWIMQKIGLMVLALQLDDVYRESLLGVVPKTCWQVNAFNVCPPLSCLRDVLCCRVSPRQTRPFCSGKRPQNH
jgi:hypothetical protein